MQWLSQKTGKRYRLLSEAEREYVTRAGTKTPFWWGTSISTQTSQLQRNFSLSIYWGNKGRISREDIARLTSLNKIRGLYQVHGNVSEWVEDCWHKNYQGAPSDGSAWVRGDCGRRMLRGGDWNSAPWQLRSASRGALASALVFLPAIGMRVARSLATR